MTNRPTATPDGATAVIGAFAQAIAAGATALMEPADQFWGDRYGVLRDPFGHQWSLAQPLADGPRTPEEMQAAFERTMSGGQA